MLVARMFITVLCMILLSVSTPVLSQPSEPDVVKIGVLAKRGVTHTLKRWSPTADYLTQHIADYRFEIVPLDFNQVFPAARSKQVDFILSNSAFYVVLEKEFGLFRIASLRTAKSRQVRSRFGGVIFVRADNDAINTLDDFSDKRFMGVEPTSLGGYMAALREFRAEGIRPKSDFSELLFGGTHDAVVYAVRDGIVDGGTVRTDTLERMSEEQKIDLADFKIIRSPNAPPASELPYLYSTRLYPEWPIAALPHVAPGVVQKVAVALLEMPNDDPAAVAAKVNGWSVPANYQPVHELLQALHLRPYEYLGRFQALQWIVTHPEVLGLLVLLLMLLLVYTTQVSRLNRRLGKSEAKLRGTIKDLEQARNQLIQSEKMAAIGQLAAGVAHEINNPISYVYSNINSLESYARDLARFCDVFQKVGENLPDEVRSEIERLQQQIDMAYVREDMGALIEESREGVERVKKIVADLKDFARHDHGEWMDADINSLLESALNIVHNELKYSAEVVRELGDLPPVHCVPGQVEQVFVNLLVNAGQAISEQGTITVRSGMQDAHTVWVDVEDTGEGIVPGHMGQLFDPFFTTKPVGKGTGLGLSISYGIIQGHGGDIQVESQPGEGSRFRVLLPVGGPDSEHSLEPVTETG